MRAALWFLLPIGLIAASAPVPASAGAAVPGDEPAPSRAESPSGLETPPAATGPCTASTPPAEPRQPPEAVEPPAVAAEPAEPDPASEPDSLPRAADEPPEGWLSGVRHTVTSDLSRFYRRGRAMRFGGALAVAGALANTDGDEEIQAWYREDVRSASGDEWAADLERLGRMETIGLPLLAGGLLVGFAPEEGSRAPVRWLRRTARAYLIGTPALLYLQPLTGGNRPAEGLGSDWQPFVGQNGVSGHAFTGAVPFLTIARQTRRPWLRVLAVAASTAGGWAQFHADQHYLSQFALGWWLAWEATDAIAESDARLLGQEAEPRVAILPVPAEGGGGVLVSLRF